MQLSTKIFIGSLIGFLSVTIIGFICFPGILRVMINNQKALREGNKIYDYYIKLPFPLEFCVYFFNVTNPSEIHQRGATPILKEVGPYCYDAYKEKVHRSVSNEEDSLAYTPYETYFYNETMTAPRSHDDYVTVLHPIMAGILNAVYNMAPNMLKLVNKALDPLFFGAKSIYLTAKVRDILFDGIKLNCSGKDFYSSAVCSQLKTNVPGLVETDDGIYLVSLLGSRNGTLSHRIKVLRGIENPPQLGQVIEYDNKTSLDIWAGEKCNKIDGTDGWIFPSFLENQDTINIFAMDLCRNLQAKFVNETQYKGMKVRQYYSTFGDIESNSEDKCYCSTPSKCLKKGVMDLTKCVGIPVYVSLPHFLEADESYQKAVKGLNPNIEDHIVRITFQAMLGMPVEAKKRIQFNFPIQAFDNVPLTKNLPTLLHPFIWLEEGVNLKGQYLKELTSKLQFLKIIRGFTWFGLVLSIVGIAVAGYLRYKNQNLVEITTIRKSNKSRVNNINENSEGNKSYVNRVMNINEPDKF